MHHLKEFKEIYSIVSLVTLLTLCCHKNQHEEINVVNISNTPGRSENPSIASDSRGYLYVVWDDQFVNEESLVIYMVSRPPGGDWSQPEKIFEPRAARVPDIEIDNSNTIHIAWQNTNPQGWGEILYSQRSLHGAWTLPETISVYGMSTTPDLAVDNSGNVHLVWVELVGSWPVFYSERNNGVWSVPVQLSLDDVDLWEEPKIAVNSDGRAHVAWISSSIAPICKNWLTYTTNAPGAWTAPEVVAEDNLLTIGGVSIACDNHNTAQIVWNQNADIYYTNELSNEQWEKPVRICSTSVLSKWPWLGSDDEGALHLTWVEDENTIYYLTKSVDGDWGELKQYIVPTICFFGGPECVLSAGNISFVFSGFNLPATGEDNYDIFFDEKPQN